MKTHPSIELYREMLRIRRVEERIAELYPEQEIRCPVHLCIGQEGVAVGVSANLKPQDYVLSGHRSHGHYLARGGNLKAMMAELWGKVTGCCQGKGGSMHLIDLSVGFLASTPIVASTIPIAVGAALGSVMKNEDRVTVVYFGEAATEEGTFHEAANYAVLKKLPVVFVCENNLYSVYSPLEVRQPPERSLVELARGHGMESHWEDGNDVLAVKRLSEHAIDHARAGKGPSLLEFSTYRWYEHCGPNLDNHIGYRTEEEFLTWKKTCPLLKLRESLLAEGICAEPDLSLIEEDLKAEIDDAVRFAKESPFGEEDLAYQHIYAT
ncbi:MAG: thiamine pyrophosphate-dependent dehydrogenase E1 component subunit alpha [Candidatus Omnitrophota bacterium]|nr:thiamine pyrophosphate-dependent dehydrogenase E1 component subunit alpha [Candidatus Omnitrophota bacterium]